VRKEPIGPSPSDFVRHEGDDGIKRPKVLLSIPNTGWVHKVVFLAVLEIVKDPRIDLTIVVPTLRPYAHNMNTIAKKVAEGPWDFWISMDDDNPPRKNPIDLIFLDKDIVGCPTPVWRYSGPNAIPWFVNAMVELPDGSAFVPCRNGNGLVEVDAIGSGCLVIAKRVCEKVKAPFMREWDDDGLVLRGCDFAFCVRAREMGFKIHAHYDYMCRHFKEHDMGEMITMVRRVFDPEFRPDPERHTEEVIPDSVPMEC
jgi:hypothetical protein